MRWLLVLPFIMPALYSFSQPGFNRPYDFGQLAVGFGSIEVCGDTIVVYGTALGEGQPAFGMSLARFDTSGNLIDHKIYYDALNRDFTQVYPNSFVKLADGTGYMGIGQYFSKNGYVAKFDKLGVLTFLKEFPDPTSQVDFYKEIQELTNGFLIFGNKQDFFSYIVNAFVTKTDFNGNIIWEKKYTTPGRQTFFGSVLIINENEYVISASTTAVQGVPLPQVTNTSKIFAIDSLGNVKWQWESQPSLEELGAGSIFKTPEGNWAYTSARGWYNATYNEISKQPKFIVRDKNFNIIRDDTFGVADYPVNYFTKAIQISSGGWLIIGLKPVYYPIPPVPLWYNSFSGWMVRLNGQGDQMWSRVDTAFWSYETGSSNYYYDAVELPGGSIIACGYSRTYEPAPKDWGWLVKVSKDGCVDTLACHPLHTFGPELSHNNIRIFPNPTASLVHIESETVPFWDRIDLLHANGQLIRTYPQAVEGTLDFSGLPDGCYFIRLYHDRQAVSKKIVVKH